MRSISCRDCEELSDNVVFVGGDVVFVGGDNAKGRVGLASPITAGTKLAM